MDRMSSAYSEREPFDRCPDCGSSRVTCTEQERATTFYDQEGETHPLSGKYYHLFSCPNCGWKSAVRIVK